MELYVLKNENGIFGPDTVEDVENIKTLPVDTPLKVVVTRPRNLKFHRKWFALIKIAFDHWDVSVDGLEYEGVKVERDFDQFRKHITILSGHYKAVFNIGGKMELIAKSISFASMSEHQFAKFFSKTFDVCLKKFCTNYTPGVLMSEVEQRIYDDKVRVVLEFDGSTIRSTEGRGE
ncbi:DUF1367 family protein [Candidatus Pacearchaeota archaeon]|nr:DUF1367 family protein [Candidatus Pacearchaeota archaeon]